ncbi:MAG: CheB methylesterase domain-containing protein, partial [candidate division WOR-3 bacterium]
STAFASELRAMVIIGASTGGPEALMNVIPKLPRDIPAGIVVAQHMPGGFTRYLAERIDALSAVDVKEAAEGDGFLPGRVLVAPGGFHFMLGDCEGKPCVMLLSKNKAQRTACPSVDFAMTSFAPVFRERLVGVVLTGMGRDGTAGCAAIRRYGGSVICQDRETSLVHGMAGSVIEAGLAHVVTSLDRIADCIANTVSEIAARETANESL